MRDLLRWLFGLSEKNTQTSSEIARERLRLVLIQDRVELAPDMMQQMKQEILEVVSRYMVVEEDFVEFEVRRLEDLVMLVSNIREDGEVIGSIPDGEMLFHTDGSYEEHPYRYTFLYAIEVPRQGGDTLFANMHTAYDTLPETLKSRLRDLDAEHGFYTGPDVTSEMKEALRISDYAGRAVHPVFTRHEETSRPSLYISRMLTRRIVGLESEDSLLPFLFDHSERPEGIYRHVWTPGDLVMWDNRCTNHARDDFEPGERRLLRRTTCQGVKPERAVLHGQALLQEA